ncbi:MAG: hypothetical protein JNL21_16290 [Myxococcales bacterium]|nr:hypothetical protein [Myxococcales bacterium]
MLDERDPSGDDFIVRAAWLFALLGLTACDADVETSATGAAGTGAAGGGQGQPTSSAATTGSGATSGTTTSSSVTTGAGGAPAMLAVGDLVPDFSLLDVNPASPTANQPVSPRDYLQRVSGWYFGHST